MPMSIIIIRNISIAKTHDKSNIDIFQLSTVCYNFRHMHVLFKITRKAYVTDYRLQYCILIIRSTSMGHTTNYCPRTLADRTRER